MAVDYAIPAIVKDLLIKINNPNVDVIEKDNIVMTIEEIARACNKEASEYRKHRAVDFAEARKHKRRR